MSDFSIKNYDFYYKLRTLPYVQEIAIYGSRAKNTNQKGSDIDLAISCPQATDAEWQNITDIIEHRDTLLSIDLVRLDRLTDQRFYQEVMVTKVILFRRVPNTYSWYEKFLDLSEALDKFEEVLHVSTQENPFMVEATIQTFEYTYELYWKVLKIICTEAGYEVLSPRQAFEQAYALELIEQERIWIEIMKTRNLTSHTYQRVVAHEIYDDCSQYYQVMRSDFTKLKTRFGL
jgi:nucleotidyltransferase substrate binding protein (TIGR01987 family)